MTSLGFMYPLPDDYSLSYQDFLFNRGIRCVRSLCFLGYVDNSEEKLTTKRNNSIFILLTQNRY